MNRGHKNDVFRFLEFSMPTLSVTLFPRHYKFVDAAVKDGRFKNPSEVVSAGLHLLEQQELEDKSKLRTLRRIAAEAFAAMDRGEYTTFTPQTLDAWFGKIDRSVRSKAAGKRHRS